MTARNKARKVTITVYFIRRSTDDFVVLSAAFPRLQFGDTPLHFAALSGDAEGMRALLEAGADCDAVQNVRT